MKLPELPKQLKKVEADWITKKFRKWLLEYKQYGAYEVKHTRGKNYLSFSEVKEHQLASLLAVRDTGFVYKIPDMGDKNPFDIIAFKDFPSYVVIKYPKGCVFIPPLRFITEREQSKRRSLTWSRAQDIASKVIHI